MSTTSLAVPQHFNKLFQSAGIQINTDLARGEDLMQEGLKHRQRSVLSAIAAGLCFKRAQEAEGRGFITQQAAALGVSRMSIYRDIDMADLFDRCPAESVTPLLQLDFTKLLLLKVLDTEEIKTLTTGGEVHGITYDDAIDLSKRELEQRLKDTNRDLQSALDSSKKENALLTEQLHALRRKHNQLEEHAYPPTVDKVRVESSIRGADVLRQIDELSQLAVDLRHAPDLDEDRDKADSQYEAGAAVLLLNIMNIKARVDHVLRESANLLGDELLPHSLDNVPMMAQGEITRVKQMAQMMTLEAKAQEQQRETDRAPRGRGRPRKQVN